MSRFIVLAALIVLGGCNTQLTPAQQKIGVQAVQGLAKSLCGFTPTSATVAGVARTYRPSDGFTNLESLLANAICSAVRSPEAYASLRPAIRGVPVQGKFTNR